MEKFRARSRWVKMLSRCEDEDNPQYHDYGGRGIYVCDEWHQFINFYNWLIEQDVSSEQQVDRINNDGPYSPENCRPVTRSQNARNKRNNRILTVNGESKTMIEWSEDSRCSVSYRALLQRILNGWSHEDAVLKELDSTRRGKIPYNAKVLTAFGESKTTSEWLNDPRCNVSHQTLWHRVNRGWDHEDAISVRSSKNNGIRYEGQTILYWSKQPECEVGYNTLATRLKNGESVSDAMKKRKTPRGRHK